MSFSTLKKNSPYLNSSYIIWQIILHFKVYFPGSSDSKASAYNVGDLGLIPGSGRSPGEGNSNPFQYSCLENTMDQGAWGATVHGVAKSWAWLSDFTFLSLPFKVYFWFVCCFHISYLCEKDAFQYAFTPNFSPGRLGNNIISDCIPTVYYRILHVVPYTYHYIWYTIYIIFSKSFW